MRLTLTCLCSAAQAPPPGAPPLPAGFAEQYTISGCADGDHCGTFSRVLANCASGDYCPGGWGEHSGNTDRSLCHGAPVYQHGGAGGPVLFRSEDSVGGTNWEVADSSVLEYCDGQGNLYIYSAINDQPGGGPPTAAAYGTGSNIADGTGWVDFDDICTSGCGIAITAAGGH